MLLIVSACSNKEETKVDKVEESQIAVVENFIEIAYFDKGTYDEFTALYADPTKVNTKEEFNVFRKENEPKDMFPKDYESVEKLKKHLIVEKVDQENANVYWLDNPDKDKTDKATSVWSVTKVEGKWLLN